MRIGSTCLHLLVVYKIATANTKQILHWRMRNKECDALILLNINLEFNRLIAGRVEIAGHGTAV